MASEMRLKLGAVFFAVFWTLGMLVWSEIRDVAGVVIFSIAGALAGLLWYWLMRMWMRWHAARS